MRLLLVATALSLCSLPTIQAADATLMPEAFETGMESKTEVPTLKPTVVTFDTETQKPSNENEDSKEDVEDSKEDVEDSNEDVEDSKEDVKRNKDTTGEEEETQIPYNEDDVKRNEPTQEPYDEDDVKRNKPTTRLRKPMKRNKPTTKIDPSKLPPELRGNPERVKWLQENKPDKLTKIIAKFGRRGNGKKRTNQRKPTKDKGFLAEP